LELQPPLQQKAHDEAHANGTIHLGMAAGIQNVALYSEYKALQVKARTESYL
jgi:hypothetical protein